MKNANTFIRYTDEVRQKYEKYIEMGWLPRLSMMYALNEVANDIADDLEDISKALTSEEINNLFD